jgi:transposase InsO family protein
VIEKEAYPIVLSCEDLDYLFLRPGGFKIFCDHRNLIHVFAPGQEIKKHVRGKLLRWSVKLMEFRYTIVHIEGANNLWADLISRWGGSVSPPTAVFKRLTTRQLRSSRQPLLRPLDQNGFVWPTLAEIASTQAAYAHAAPTGCECDGNKVQWCGSTIWIPAEATDLVQRLMIVAHCGAQGHRGEAVMLNHLQRLFAIEGLVKFVRRFLRSCLLCLHAKGGRIIPRPWGELYRADTRNEALHFDFLFLGEGFGTCKYLLVMKDNFSHFCELIPCDTPISEVTVEGLLDWHSRFGIPSQWLSDNGSHFKNLVMTELCRRLKCQQSFVVAYSPWVNGSVERANRDILQVLRTMILEYGISHQDWMYLVPLVQANLNHSPVVSLANRAPVEVFTGLPCPAPVYVLFLPGEDPREVAISSTSIEQSLTKLRASIEGMHREVVDKREKITLLNKRKSRGAQEVNFSVGDYVLRSRVDERRHNKPLVTWIGPYVVTRADAHSFRVRHLITGKEQDVHASRLKFYADSDLEVTEELLEHVAAQGIVLKAEKLVEHRWNSESKRFELLMSWCGLEALEDSWEPLQSLTQDIPVLVNSYVDAAKNRKMSTAFKALTSS